MNWNESTIKAFAEASEYTKFHENLSKEIKPYLKGSKTLCDMGCGLGCIDFFLKDEVDSITCIDLDSFAIEYLENKIKESGIQNIRCKKLDFKKIEEKFDTILASFFAYDEIEFFSKLCNRLIVVVNDRGKTHLPISKKRESLIRKYSTANIIEELEEKELKYKLEKINLEFGQTFYNMEEIQRYARSYDQGEEYEKIYKYILDNVVRGEKIPYYLPYEKEISIFVIDFK